jgi:DNA-binding response OmpR family regulator
VRSAIRQGAPKILHVEHDPDLPQVMASLTGKAVHLRHAGSLQAAEQWLRRERFDLIILDLSLPDGSGLNLLPIINSSDHPPPVLVLSAHELSADLARQVNAALVKSRTDNFKLLETVHVLLDSGARDGTGPGGDEKGEP